MILWIHFRFSWKIAVASANKMLVCIVSMLWEGCNDSYRFKISGNQFPPDNRWRFGDGSSSEGRSTTKAIIDDSSLMTFHVRSSQSWYGWVAANPPCGSWLSCHQKRYKMCLSERCVCLFDCPNLVFLNYSERSISAVYSLTFKSVWFTIAIC